MSYASTKISDLIFSSKSQALPWNFRLWSHLGMIETQDFLKTSS